MPDKTSNLTKAKNKVITYGSVIKRLNDIARTSGDDFACFSIDLNDIQGNKTIGFVFSSTQQEVALSKLLDDLGFKHSHVLKSIKSQNGELHINPEFHNRARDLFYAWSSVVTIEPRITGNAEIDAQWNQIVSITR